MKFNQYKQTILFGGVSALVKKRLRPLRLEIIFTLLALSGILTAGCAPALLGPVGPSRQPPAEQRLDKARPRIDMDALELRIHQLVNQERVKNALPPLAWNPTLSKIARLHSQDMAARNYFGHNSLEGHDLSYRFSQQRFVCAISVGTIYYTGSENIYQCSLYKSIEYVNGTPVEYHWNDLETIAQTIVKGWMSSPGHKVNILEPAWRTQGIGVAVTSDYKVYITDDFC